MINEDLVVTDQENEFLDSSLREILDSGDQDKLYKYLKKKLVAIDDEGKFLEFEDFCEYYGIDREQIKSWKLVSHSGTPFYNLSSTNFEPEDLSFLTEDFVQEILDKYTEVNTNNLAPKQEVEVTKTDTYDRLVWSDVHIGMNPNADDIHPYASEWNGELLKADVDTMINYTISNKRSNVLYIDELGDFVDGFDGQTTRGGHHLPQNMDNLEMFDVAVEVKVSIVDRALQHYDRVVMHSITNDNHAGSFAAIVNSAVKTILDNKYGERVDVVIQKKFMDHYFVGDDCYILTHGKDAKHMKFGFKPYLDPRGMERIDNYIKEHKLYLDANNIYFCKGDSHQAIYDHAISDHFHYLNYPAFSPPSEWVSTNFKKGRRGFVFYTCDYESENMIQHPYWFA